MATERTCPSCGKALPESAPKGLCPECLMKAGFDTGSAPEPGAPTQPISFTPPGTADLAKLFPQLEITRFLGKGGMGAVYEARQPALDRLVALKILPPKNGSDPGFAERFTREARALARLCHPNIVAVHDFGKAGDFHYFIMEFVDGANLRQIEQAGKLSPGEALKLIPQICEALQFAHNEGIVHRDIKPENILVDKRGRVKIADFGIAKILGKTGDARLTGAQDVVGTPHYMAPEQVEKPHSVDHRADIFSLGVVFYEMLTGELPLGKFAAPSKRVQVDVRLDQVVLHALEKEPERRYQQVSALGKEVETIAHTPPPSRPSPAQRSEIIRQARLLVFPPCIGFGLVALTEIVLLAQLALAKTFDAGGAKQLAEFLRLHLQLPAPALDTALLIVWLAASALTIFAACRLMKLRSFSLGIAAAFLSFLPFPGFNLLRLGLGMWLLIVLLLKRTRIAFAMLRTQPEALAQTAAAQPATQSTDNDMKNSSYKPLWYGLALGAVCLLLAPAGGYLVFGADATKLTQEGWKLWQARQLDEAAEKFSQAVKAAPKNTDAWNGLGWATFNAGKNGEAEKAFKKVIALEPGHPAALNGLGQLYLSEGKFDQAEEYLLKAAPQASAAWYGLARLYLLQGKFDDAEKWARKLVDSGEPDNGQGEMLKAAQDKKVSESLRRKLAPPPSTPPVSDAVSRSWKLMNSGRRVEARELLESALKKNPSDANAENALGWCLLNGGQPAEAKPHFQKATQLDPNAAGAMNGLARVYKTEGKDDEAIKLWQQMVEKFPGPHAGTYGLAEAYFERKQFDKALPLLEELAKANPSDTQLKARLERAREGIKK